MNFKLVIILLLASTATFINSVDAENRAHSTKVQNTNETPMRLDSIISNTYNTNDETYSESSKQVFNYNSNNQVVKNQTLRKTEQGWKLMYKTEYAYNANKLLSEQIVSMIEDIDYPEYNDERRSVYEYDSNGILISIESSYKVSSEELWEQGNISFFKHDSEENITEETYEYNQNNDSIKIINYYNQYGDDTLQMKYLKNNDDKEWLESIKNESIYSKSHQLLQLSKYSINYSEWKLERRTDFQVSVDGNTETSVNYFLNYIDDSIYVTDSTYYIYDKSGEYTNLVFPFDFYDNQISLKNMLVKTESIGFLRGTSTQDRKTTSNYYYSGVNTSVADQFNQANIQVYPNPAANYFTVDLGQIIEATITIYKTNGTKVYQGNVMNGQQINIKEFDSGVYLYAISFDQKIVHGKLIVSAR